MENIVYIAIITFSLLCEVNSVNPSGDGKYISTSEATLQLISSVCLSVYYNTSCFYSCFQHWRRTVKLLVFLLIGNFYCEGGDTLPKNNFEPSQDQLEATL